MKKKTIGKIRQAVHAGTLLAEFTPAMVNDTLGINWAGTFLPKHRVGNPANNTELFIRIQIGLYKLKTNA